MCYQLEAINAPRISQAAPWEHETEKSASKCRHTKYSYFPPSLQNTILLENIMIMKKSSQFLSFSQLLMLRVFNGVFIQYQTVSITEKVNCVDAPVASRSSIADKQSLVFSLRNVRIKRYWFLLTMDWRKDKVCSRWDWLVSSHKKGAKIDTEAAGGPFLNESNDSIKGNY